MIKLSNWKPRLLKSYQFLYKLYNLSRPIFIFEFCRTIKKKLENLKLDPKIVELVELVKKALDHESSRVESELEPSSIVYIIFAEVFLVQVGDVFRRETPGKVPADPTARQISQAQDSLAAT